MAVLTPNLLLIECLVPQLKQLMLAITRFDDEIKTLYKQHIDRAIFDSLPGAGPQLAPCSGQPKESLKEGHYPLYFPIFYSMN